MKNLKPLEYKGQRVLLSKQLVEVFGCVEGRIRDNFRHHNARFTQGEHYFKVSGEWLRQFKAANPTLAIGKFAASLLLWTRSGAAVHADLINTPQVREAFAALERDYFVINSNVPQIFNHPDFGNVRVIMRDVAWFIAADICRALELGNVSKALNPLEDDEKTILSVGGVTSSYTHTHEQNMLAVNEPGLYRLIFQSRKPEAKKFQRWVYHEVLPSIRKTGSYSVNPEPQEAQEEMASVYGFLMNNNLVKIGQSGDIERRIPEVERESGWNVVDEHHTKQMPVKRARYEEKRLHRKFSAVKVNGEYFNVDFEIVKEEIDCIALAPSDYDKKLLVELCKIDSPFKERLVQETANLLFGEKIF